MMLTDAVEVGRTRRTKDGYLVADAKVARTGIQTYFAGELGLDGDPTRQVRLYRPPDEVFARDAMASYAHRPVTIDHPTELVTSDNWKEHASGQTGDEVMRDGDFVRVPVMLLDQEAIKAVETGRKELSMGYTMTLDMSPGETADGQKYDAVQKDLRMNHLAIVARARGGSELRLGDDTMEDCTVQTKTITVDGIPVETNDAGAQVIAKLQKDVVDSAEKLETASTTHAEALAAKDKELAAKDAEIDSLKGKVLDADALDAAVRERADLISQAKLVADKDYTGLTPVDIRKTALTAKLGSKALDGKSDEYVAARFDIEVEAADEDPVRKDLKDNGSQRPRGDDKQTAYDEMLADKANAWKAPTSTEVN